VRTFSRTSQFKKDVKKAEKRGKDLQKLRVVLDLLIDAKPLPDALRDHALQGEFKGSRDLHIEPDWLLIYTLEKDHLRLERTGTHADLFR
jgi:mRNA interferase YafQ